MIKIEVQSVEVETKAGTSNKTGKPYAIREQTAYASLIGRDGKAAPYPVKVRLMLDDAQAPYPVGLHQLDPSSIYVDRFGQLSLRATLLTSIKPAIAKAA